MVPEQQSISDWNLLQQSVCLLELQFWGGGVHLAGRLIRVSEGDRHAEWSPDRRQTRRAAPQNGLVRSVWEEKVGGEKKIKLKNHY